MKTFVSKLSRHRSRYLLQFLFVRFVYFIFKHLAQLILCLLGLGSGLFPDKLYIPGNVVHLCTGLKLL